MRASSITLSNLRNHGATALTDLSERINVLAGPNGAGKTSVLEALSLTTVTKSFTTHTDAVLIRKGETRLEAQTEFVSDLDVPMRVSVTVDLGPPLKKSIFVNSERLRSAADLVGRPPVVVLTPDDKAITSGGPGDRRRFLNMVLSQASHTYLEDESEYRKALKHRNAVLTEARVQGRGFASIEAMLHPWTELVIKHGARIMSRRSTFTEEFGKHLLVAYQALSERREAPSIRYLPMGDVRGSETGHTDFVALLRAASETTARDELRRGTTLFGPHRDEVALEINAGQEARLYASQGQHKTLLVAMKVAEYEYLREATQETPIMLLDDVFSELDTRRAALLIEYTQQPSFGQTFITTTDRAFFERTLPRAIHKLWTADRDSHGARIERAEAN
jgi:DNA replication and repair protein RecF